MKTLFTLALVLFVCILTSGCGQAEASALPKETDRIFSTDSVQYEMAAQLCDNKHWAGSVCPALLTLTQELDAGRFARYPAMEDAASQQVSRMVLRVIAMDSLETVIHLQDILEMEK